MRKFRADIPRGLMSDAIALLSLAETGRRLDRGSIDPIALVENCLSRIEAHDGKLASFLHIDPAIREKAKAATLRISREGRVSPLDGIPLGVKDVFDTHDMPTTANSRLFLDNRPTQDAVAVEWLRRAGGLMLGKLAAWECAMGGTSVELPWPPARNPWAFDRDPGGSSTGSAAALAAGFLYGALGTDTGGSIREPAAWCGLAGLKPSYGLVPLEGTMAASFTLDHAGPMARTSEDCALLLDAITGANDRRHVRALSRGVDGLRIGLVDLGSHMGDLDHDVAATLVNARHILEIAGARFHDAELPPLELFSAVVAVVASVEGFALHRHRLELSGPLYDPLTRQRIEAGATIDGATYVDALALREQLCRKVAALFDRFDLLLMPMTYGPAPRLGGFDSHGGHPSLGRPWNVTGAPALSVRSGFSRDGLPLAVQIIGPPGADGLVLAAGHAVEQGLGIAEIWPDLKWTTRWPADTPDIAQPDPKTLATAIETAVALVQGAVTKSGCTLGAKECL